MAVDKLEEAVKPDLEKIASLIHELLIELGEDPNREGLKKTPMRVAKAFEYLTKGYREDIEKVLNGAVFNEKYNEMVIVKNIDFFSLCEHHLLPFYGKVHIAYIPNGKIVGLSKIPRIVEVFQQTASSSGEIDTTNSGYFKRISTTQGRRCCDRSKTPLHDNAWG
jgi:GTP cyclohydrolase I